MPNIVETAIAANSFKTLMTAVKAAGLGETLSGPGPFTVFAPNDEAFARQPKAAVEDLPKNIPKLKRVLTYHVVAGKKTDSTIPSLAGAESGLKGGGMVNDPCVFCGGTGAIRCNHCGGTGINQNSSLLDDQCHGCKGTGREICHDCRGSGEWCPVGIAAANNK